MELNEKRWDSSAIGYSALVQKELESGLGKSWLQLIMRYISEKKILKVLDVGTGPGFFLIIFAKEGHEVTGIDCSSEMLSEAQHNLSIAGASAQLRQVTGVELPFENNTFDLVLSRNVTWTLFDPEKAFCEWNRVLKPGGTLCYADGNWNPEVWSDEVKKLEAQDRESYLKFYGKPENTYTGDQTTIQKFDAMARLYHEHRPQWDREHLADFGFENIEIIENINSSALTEPKQLLYRHTPMFLVSARKPCSVET